MLRVKIFHIYLHDTNTHTHESQKKSLLDIANAIRVDGELGLVLCQAGRAVDLADARFCRALAKVQSAGEKEEGRF